MAITIEITETSKKEVAFLQAECGVRYWEDASVNDVEDEDGTLIPCRVKDAWCPLIDLATGVIKDWPAGTTADIHYKVCDAGIYKLLDADMNVVKSIDGYVPKIMSPQDNGYGDYIIMQVGAGGDIANWRIDLDAFEGERD
jgi:hypothetical protein